MATICSASSTGDIDESGVFAYRSCDRRVSAGQVSRDVGEKGVSRATLAVWGIGVVYACLVFLELELLVGWSYEVKLDEELTTLSSISGLQGSLERETDSAVFMGSNAFQPSGIVLCISKLVPLWGCRGALYSDAVTPARNLRLLMLPDMTNLSR